MTHSHAYKQVQPIVRLLGIGNKMSQNKQLLRHAAEPSQKQNYNQQYKQYIISVIIVFFIYILLSCVRHYVVALDTAFYEH